MQISLLVAWESLEFFFWCKLIGVQKNDVLNGFADSGGPPVSKQPLMSFIKDFT